MLSIGGEMGRKLKEKKTMDEGENSEVARMGRTEHLYIAVGASRP